MSNLLDLNPRLQKNKDDAWITHIYHMSKNAQTVDERIFYGELKLAYQFDMYLHETGMYHPNDPAMIEELR